MKIVQAFPCRCRFADKENAPKVEEEVLITVKNRIHTAPQARDKWKWKNLPHLVANFYFNVLKQLAKRSRMLQS